MFWKNCSRVIGSEKDIDSNEEKNTIKGIENKVEEITQKLMKEEKDWRQEIK